MTILLSDLEIICLLAIAVFGVPHGAYDYEFIKTATKERGSNFALMIAAYLTLVILSFNIMVFGANFFDSHFSSNFDLSFWCCRCIKLWYQVRKSKTSQNLLDDYAGWPHHCLCYHCFIEQRFQNIFASSKATMEHC